MTPLVFLAVLGVCSAGPFTGYTPEVQAERARFFQSFSAAQAAAAPQQAYYHHAAAPQQALYHHAAPVQPKWTGPVAATVPAGVDGTITPVSDTHEVAAARNAFNSAYQAQLRATVGAVPAVHAHAPAHHHVPAHHTPPPTTTPQPSLSTASTTPPQSSPSGLAPWQPPSPPDSQAPPPRSLTLPKSPPPSSSSSAPTTGRRQLRRPPRGITTKPHCHNVYKI
nr:cuticle protein CP1876-like [Penaeus vannamei]